MEQTREQLEAKVAESERILDREVSRPEGVKDGYNVLKVAEARYHLDKNTKALANFNEEN